LLTDFNFGTMTDRFGRKETMARNHEMATNRRAFIQAAGAAGAVLFVPKTLSADAAAPPADRSEPASRAPFLTELFLDNQLLEATPGVSRKLHPAKKRLLNPVIRPERWCEGTRLN
jgi:hypothetical protein